MKALLIKDELVWHDSTSVALGAHLDISDSSNNLLIFGEGNNERDIMNLIGDVSDEAYQLLEVEQVPEDECEFMADSGICYRRIAGHA